MEDGYSLKEKPKPVKMDAEIAKFVEKEFTVAGRNRIEQYLSGAIPPANTTFGRVAKIIRDSKGNLSKDQMDAIHASHLKAIEHPKPMLIPGYESAEGKLGILKFMKPLPQPGKKLDSEKIWAPTQPKKVPEPEIAEGPKPSERMRNPQPVPLVGKAEKREGKYEHLFAVTVYVDEKPKTYGVSFSSDVKKPMWKDVSTALASGEAGVSLAEKGGVIRAIRSGSPEYAHLTERASENDMKLKLL